MIFRRYLSAYKCSIRAAERHITTAAHSYQRSVSDQTLRLSQNMRATNFLAQHDSRSNLSVSLLGARYCVVLTCMYIDTIAYCNCFVFSLAYLVKIHTRIGAKYSTNICFYFICFVIFHVLIGGGVLSPIFFLLLFYLIVISFDDDNTPMQYTAIQKFISLKNQRTNGPVNAHLIYGPTARTKTNKIGKSQPRYIIYINFVELESPMLHAKFQDHRTSGSGEDF